MESELFAHLLETGLKLGWDKRYAKWSHHRHQSLLYHSLNVALIVDKLASLLNINKTLVKPLIIGAFFHDFAKESEKFQELVKYNTSSIKYVPKVRKDTVKKVSNLMREFGLNEYELNIALGVAFLSELPGDAEDLLNQLNLPSVPRILQEIISIADAIVSIRSVNEIDSLNKRIKAYGFYFTYHSISTIRGITTQLLHKALERIFTDKGFTPIAYTPYATIYIGKIDSTLPSVSRDELARRVFDEFTNILNSFNKGNIASAIYGEINKTVIKSPRYLLIDGVIEAFWNYIAEQFSDVKATSSFVNEVKYICKDLGIQEENSCRELANKLRAIHYMLVVFKTVANKLKELIIENELEDEMDESSLDDLLWDKLIEAYKLNKNKFKELKVDQLALQTKTALVVKAVKWFAESLGLLETSLSEALGKLAESFSKITEEAVKDMKERYPNLLEIVFMKSFKDLCNDVSHPMLFNPVEEVRNVYKRYFGNKSRDTPLCNICGKPASVKAQEPKIGEGTESFTNFLEAGASIEGENKVWICSVCDLEAELRSLYGIKPDRYSVFYIVPMFIANYDFNKTLWSKMIDAFKVAEFSPEVHTLLRDQWWATKVTEPEGLKWLEDLIVKILKNIFTIVEEAKSEKIIIRKLAEILKKEYEELDFFKMKYEWCKDVISFEDAAECIYKSGKIPVDIDIQLPPRIAFYSNNYLVVFTIRRLKRGDENESIELLRRMFVGLILAKLFQSSVYIPEIELEPIFEIKPRGYLRYVYKTTLRPAFDQLGLEPEGKGYGWVPIHLIDDILIRLAALIVIDDKMRKKQVNYGSNSLLELVTRPPGMVLLRYLEGFNVAFSRKGAAELLEFIRCLDIFSRR